MQYQDAKDLLRQYGMGESLSLEKVDSQDIRGALSQVFRHVPQAVVLSCQNAIDEYLQAMNDHKHGEAVSRNKRDVDYLTKWISMSDQFVQVGKMDETVAGLAAGSLRTLAEMLEYTE